MSELLWFGAGMAATIAAYFVGRLHAGWRIEGSLLKAIEYEWRRLRGLE